MDGPCDSLWNPRRQAKRRKLYETWVRDHAADLYRMAYRLCGEAETAEDLVQETFYHAWKDMAGLRETAKARAWLYQILRHRYAHWVRGRTRRIPASSSDQGVDRIDPSPSAAMRMSQQEQLQRVLDELDDTLKVPLLMVFLEGMMCQEAADVLDIPLGTVLSRIHRARQRLRSYFELPSASPAGEVGRDSSKSLRLGGGA